MNFKKLYHSRVIKLSAGLIYGTKVTRNFNFTTKFRGNVKNGNVPFLILIFVFNDVSRGIIIVVSRCEQIAADICNSNSHYAYNLICISS